LGAVAAILADGKLSADAMVLEAGYGTFHDAIANCLVMRLGAVGNTPTGSGLLTAAGGISGALRELVLG